MFAQNVKKHNIYLCINEPSQDLPDYLEHGFRTFIHVDTIDSLEDEKGSAIRECVCACVFCFAVMYRNT